MGVKKDKDGNVIDEKDDEKDPPGGDDGKGGKKPPADDDDTDDLDDDGEQLTPEEQKAYLAKLRKENAAARIKNKDLESKFKDLSTKFSNLEKGIKKAVGADDDEELTPDQLKAKLEEKDTKIGQLQGQMALLNAADEHGIPAAGRKYFALLIDEAASEMEDGEELPEEKLTEIVKEVKARFGKAGNSSVDGDGKGNPPPPGGGGDKVTVERFAKMTTTEKSVLYEKQPELYSDLFRQAKEKHLLI